MGNTQVEAKGLKQSVRLQNVYEMCSLQFFEELLEIVSQSRVPDAVSNSETSRFD
jgi:hypothetical protein